MMRLILKNISPTNENDSHNHIGMIDEQRISKPVSELISANLNYGNYGSEFEDRRHF